MKEIFFSPYQLTSGSSLNAQVQSSDRHGTLLMVRWDDGLVGFADLHPWTELGDLVLSEQLEKVREGRLTPLSHSSLWLARRDAEARFAGKNLLPEKGQLKNNALISSAKDISDDSLNNLKLQGFDTVKIKLGRDLKTELQQLRLFQNMSFRLRFDFNNTLDKDSYEKFMSELLPEVRQQVEYVEDPFSYDVKSWQAVKKWAPLAVDQDLERALTHGHPAFDVAILKPAKSDVAEVFNFSQKHGCKVTVTNYMDHPVGIIHAASVAHEMHKEYGDIILESGCLTHHLFVENDFSRMISSEGPYLSAVKGDGVGFDELLEALSWQHLARL